MKTNKVALLAMPAWLVVLALATNAMLSAQAQPTAQPGRGQPAPPPQPQPGH